MQRPTRVLPTPASSVGVHVELAREHVANHSQSCNDCVVAKHSRPSNGTQELQGNIGLHVASLQANIVLKTMGARNAASKVAVICEKEVPPKDGDQKPSSEFTDGAVFVKLTSFTSGCNLEMEPARHRFQQEIAKALAHL